MLSRLFSSVQTDPSRLFLSRRNSFFQFLSAEFSGWGGMGKFFGILLGPATTIFQRRFSAVRQAASLRGGLREVSS